MASAPAPGRRWFFGPVPDLLFGAGLLYAAFFAVQTLAGESLRALVPYTALPLLTLFLGTPHYGATLLRVYEHRADRRKYALFAVWATLALLALYAAGLRSVFVGSLLLTVYLTWSPWHYTGQNYGIALLFFRRRGVAVPTSAKRFLYASFVLSYVLVFLAIHSPTGSQDYAPADYQGTVFHFLSLGVPASLHLPVTFLGVVAYLACLTGAGWVLSPGARWRDLAPGFLVVATQAVWFTVPTIAVQWGTFQGVEPLRAEHRAYAFMWVAVGHFVQYLWITTFYSAASEGTPGRIRYLGKTLLAGVALWVFPTLVFAPGALGTLPFDFGLALLTASVVNIHHFILDGAIWKLRDGPIARRLLRDPGERAPAGGALPQPEGRSLLRPAVWAVGGACLAISLALKIDQALGERAARAGDLDRLREAYARRAWLGRDSPRVRLELARESLRRGELEAARADLARSLALHPTPEAHAARAELFRRTGALRAARADCRSARALDPDHVEALVECARVWLALERPDRAREALERARGRAPDDPDVRALVRRLAASGPAPRGG